ncbi:hypothetical protein RI103_36350 [Paraburkholderia sp. FT54]|jgi:hypothetical protein|uniref:hypothetical protein n=1 Tax=Paraburkholderia sp. FT54 TaxID=3074437 RepID=UPI002877AE64|nr:hypothetical protein [Paraburkholderia sp. FT54]WNC94613.1 hypothetical protein RI103_36350 [Paraburkholderia sp. FT54]
MAVEYIRDDQHRVVGSIETDSGGKQIARDVQFRRVGVFDPKVNQTRDDNFRIVGTGNQLAALIWRAVK